MKTRALTVMAILAAAVFFAAACGPGGDLRVEQSVSGTDQIQADGKSPSLRIVSGTTTWGIPTSLTSHRGMMFASVDGRYGVGVQAIDTRTSQALGTVITSYSPSSLTTVASTPTVIWVLTSGQGSSRLTYFDTRNLETAQLLHTIGVQGTVDGMGQHPLILPSDTSLVGATTSALWLVTHDAHGYMLVRRDAHTSKVDRLALATSGAPGVAVTNRRVFVFLQARKSGSVRIQTRDSAGTVVATSLPLQIPGFQPRSLRGCGDQIFGWTHSTHRASLFGVRSNGERLRFSKQLPPFVEVFRAGDISGVNGIELSDHCRTVWAATASGYSGVVSRLRASSLGVTGQINTSYISALLWMGWSLWGASVDHSAVMRIR